MKNKRKLRLGKLSACLVRRLCGFAFVIGLATLVFGGAILNRYGKGKAERAFAKACPGYSLRLGTLNYALFANRLVAQSATLSASNVTLKTGRIEVTGVGWARLLRRTAVPAQLLAKATLQVTNLDAEFPGAEYVIHCARLRASGPDSELIAEGTELRPLAGDEELFATRAFRSTRFHVVVPQCRVLGLAYADLFEGKSYRAQSVEFVRPWFEALINRDKLPKPFVKSPLMLHEALALIPQPFQVGTLNVSNGHLRYCERLAIGAEPAVLTVGAISLSAEGIANRGEATAAVQVRGQGVLMDAGTMKLVMSIPIMTTNCSLHYSGSLSAMDLTRLDGFLDIAEHTRIKSGSAQEGAFDIDVTSGQASGRVFAVYKDLEIALLDKKTGDEKGLTDRVASFFANALKIRNANTADASSKVGEVKYTKRPDDEFQQFLWFALRTGVLDLINN